MSRRRGRFDAFIGEAFSGENLGGCFAVAAVLIGLGLLIAFGDKLVEIFR